MRLALHVAVPALMNGVKHEQRRIDDMETMKRSPDVTWASLLEQLKGILILTYPELAEHLGVSISTLEGWLYRGVIPRPPKRRKIAHIASGRGLTIPN